VHACRVQHGCHYDEGEHRVQQPLDVPSAVAVNEAVNPFNHVLSLGSRLL
jgi:hypothetical protein